MFGFVNNALENLVIRTYGFEKWKEVLMEAGVSLDDHHFLKSLLYDDYDTYALVEAACTVLGLTSDELMEQFGDQFFHWCQESGYDQVLKLLGRNLGEFLASLDALHDHLQLTYPGMQAPSFRIAKHPDKPNGLHLHYDSIRVGLQHIVRGIILTVARSIFDIQVDISIIETSQPNPAQFHAIFSIVPLDDKSCLWERSALTNQVMDCESTASKEVEQFISRETFCQLFPFHILFDRDLNIKQMGDSFSRLLPGAENKGSMQLARILVLERPHTTLTFANIQQHAHTVFVMKMRYARKELVAPRFKGQMMYLPHIDCMMYVCSPRVLRLKELEEQGLFLSDIPMHDTTREVVMTAEASHAHLNMFQKLEETTDELLSSKNALTVEKSKTDALLHSILPKAVAKQILSKREVVPEVFGAVTILFSDICGFTSICGQCSPIEVIDMLNELYTMFDYLTTVSDVYKVETIGDAYMVVGGLPETCDDHAARIANFALDMRHACSKVMRPDKPDIPIEIRIGFHSGEVMAGVVGTKTPRYCLFGDCVNIASRTESNGIAGRINLSNDAYQHLDQTSYILEDRGDVAFKGRTDKMHCWFLNDHVSRKPCDVTVDEAREVSTFLEALAQDEELRNQSISPYNSCDTTPKTSLGERNVSTSSADGMRFARGMSSEVGESLPRLRKSSAYRPPSIEELVRDGGTGSMLAPSSGSGPSSRHSYGDAPNSGPQSASGGCPVMQMANGTDGKPRQMRRRASLARGSMQQPRSVSDPTAPLLENLDSAVLERHMASSPQVSTARSSRAERVAYRNSLSNSSSPMTPRTNSRSPGVLRSGKSSNAASAKPSQSGAPSSSASSSSLSSSSSSSSSGSSFLKWYAAGTTAACLALISLQVYQRVRN